MQGQLGVSVTESQSRDLTWRLAHLALGLTLWACHPYRTLQRWWGQGCCLPSSSGPRWSLLGTPLLTDTDTQAVSISVCLTEPPFLWGNKGLFFHFLSWFCHRNALTHDHTLSSLSCQSLLPPHLSVWKNLCDGLRSRRRMESVLLPHVYLL